MLDSKCKGIKELIFDRLYKIHEEILPRDHEYQELGKEPGEIFTQLFASLSSEDRKNLDDYDAGQTLQMNRQDEVIYSQGLIDGILFGYWVDRIRQDPEVLLAELGVERLLARD